MKSSDRQPDWVAQSLPEQGREDLRLLKEFGDAHFDVDAGLAKFEERIANVKPGRAAFPRGLLVGAVVLAGASTVVGFASFRPKDAPPAVASVATPIPSADAPAALLPPPNEPTTAATAIPSLSVDALPTVSTSRPKPVPANTTPTTTVSPNDGDLVEAEVRHASTLRVVARTDPRAALELAAEGDRRFPRGMLHAEREAIAIEALARLERWSEAKTRADAFAAAYPTHPRTARIRAISKGERPWEP
ncbi:hypothetical protein AKJ09_07120 [Labilithrix luteola]|uniref:Uncharacterized protein n=1 Tax=Labilithrix luteola TaxID=1391654 RepID=A0A0K1Q486_9BACT|nr:hypothetical protein [Labilithrix luteola]AKV00457.1 hypothetical protein AKJ09_07120 [Labilithrix luteola]